MHVNILGIRGIPAAHGGFESFAAELAPFLVEKGHSVLVYCQADEPVNGTRHWEDEWNGIRRVFFAPKRTGAISTMEFDAMCVRDVVRRPGVDLVLGYNTALFNFAERLKGRRIAMNMDGIEWKRDKWSLGAKAWFFVNEVVGANLCDVPIADHPEIARHTARRTVRKPVMIPYGSDVVTSAREGLVRNVGVEPGSYLISIARIEPENSILPIVEAFSAFPRDMKLLVLGKLEDDNPYHREIRQAASDEVIFPGAIYEVPTVRALRFHARAYLHGHTVGGTNPSLVEALGAGNAVIAHDNKFNRWVAGEGQFYFSDSSSLETSLRKVIEDDAAVKGARQAARLRHTEAFTWDKILSEYERVLLELDGKAKG